MKKRIALPIIGILCLALIGTGILASNLDGRLVQAEDELWEAQTIAAHLILDYLPEDEWIEEDGHLYLLRPLGSNYWDDPPPSWGNLSFNRHVIWSQVVQRFFPDSPIRNWRD